MSPHHRSVPAVPRHSGGRRTSAVLVALCLAAAGCAEADSAGAEGEDPLVVYVGRDEELVAPLLDQFEAESGIELETRYAETGDLVALLLEEGEETPADVFLSQDAGALGTLAAAGMFSELPSDITGAVDAGFTSTDASWVGVTGRARVFAYNGELLDEAEVPGSVASFTDPEWAGRVGFPPGNASFQSFVTGFRSAEGDDAARDWLEAMVANDAQQFESNGDVLQAIEDGVVDVGLINHYYAYQLAAEVGQENVATRLKFPDAGDPGGLVNVTGAGILSDEPDAEQLVAFLVSDPAQEYFVESTYEYPLVDGVPAPEGLPPLAEIDGPVEDLAELDDLEATVTMLEEVGLG